MSSMQMDWARHAPPAEEVPTGLRILGTALRTAFIAALLILTVKVSQPQSETIWTAYDTPVDLARMALGLLVCVWIALQCFAVPNSAQGLQTWVYLGLTALPFAVICIVVVW